MSDEKSDQATPIQEDGAAQCCSGCACGAASTGRKGKLAICLIVLAAALLVLARGFTRKAETRAAQAKTTFSVTLPAPTIETPPVAVEKPEKTTETTPAKTASATLPAPTIETPPAMNEAAKRTSGAAQAKTASATTRPTSTPKAPLVAVKKPKKTTETAPAQIASTMMPVSPPPPAPDMAEKPKETQTDQAKSSLWGETLTSLDELNRVAIQKDAVFVYVLGKGQEAVESVKQQIEKAVGKTQAGGTKIACYILDVNSPDYAKIINQTPSPCVLAIYKGRGTSVVSGQITEEKLLQAIVTASSCGPSGCAPSGCGTSGCN